jgi:hypothetical protein
MRDGGTKICSGCGGGTISLMRHHTFVCSDAKRSASGLRICSQHVEVEY